VPNLEATLRDQASVLAATLPMDEAEALLRRLEGVEILTDDTAPGTEDIRAYLSKPDWTGPGVVDDTRRAYMRHALALMIDAAKKASR
jgi:hypothetical protein